LIKEKLDTIETEYNKIKPRYDVINTKYSSLGERKAGVEERIKGELDMQKKDKLREEKEKINYELEKLNKALKEMVDALHKLSDDEKMYEDMIYKLGLSPKAKSSSIASSFAKYSTSMATGSTAASKSDIADRTDENSVYQEFVKYIQDKIDKMDSEELDGARDYFTPKQNSIIYNSEFTKDIIGKRKLAKGVWEGAKNLVEDKSTADKFESYINKRIK
jgi:hypothetical protein